jgi:hypothetical protein
VTKPTQPKAEPAKAGQKDVAAAQEALLDFNGLSSLIELGRTARSEFKSKNRTIMGLVLGLVMSTSLNLVQHYNKEAPGLLGELPDGRIRPLPLLSDPLYANEEIRDWADKCVKKIYRLSYVDWQESIANDTQCLSDNSRQGFKQSLDRVGLLKYLNPEVQGQIHAITNTAVLRNGKLTAGGYAEWIVDVPYKLVVDGRQRGSIDLVITMRIRRVSLTWRSDGLWVENYTVQPKSPGN